MTAPWTPRDRALREALEASHKWWRHDMSCQAGLKAQCKCQSCIDKWVAELLADPPPPDPRDQALRLAEEELKKAKCRCTKALNNTCPTCGETLIAVCYSGYLNEDQWDAIKGGDWYCNTCSDPSIVNGKKHWHDCELQTVTYQTCYRCEALAAIAAAKGEK